METERINMLRMKHAMRKNFLLIIVCVMICSLMASCSSAEKKGKTNENCIPLNEEEKQLLDAVNEDIKEVTDENYIETLVELISHTEEFSGQLYQMEGMYVLDDGIPYLSRDLVNGGEVTALALPLVYMTKEMTMGAWVKVTGIINEGEIEGEKRTVLEVIAIESLPETGQAELQWDGKFKHQH